MSPKRHRLRQHHALKNRRRRAGLGGRDRTPLYQLAHKRGAGQEQNADEGYERLLRFAPAFISKMALRSSGMRQVKLELY